MNQDTQKLPLEAALIFLLNLYTFQLHLQLMDLLLKINQHHLNLL